MPRLAKYSPAYIERENKIYTLTEAAAYLRTSFKTVKRLVDAGEIPCARLTPHTVRITQRNLDLFLNGRSREASQKDTLYDNR